MANIQTAENPPTLHSSEETSADAHASHEDTLHVQEATKNMTGSHGQTHNLTQSGVVSHSVGGAVAAPSDIAASGLPTPDITASENTVSTTLSANTSLTKDNTTSTVATTETTPPMPLDSSFTWGGYFQAVGTLFLLLAILWGIVWAIRKYGKFNFLPRPNGFPRDGLRVEAQLPIGPKKSLMVVHFLNKRLLLGVTDSQITLIKEVRGHNDDDNNENFMDFKDVIEHAERQNADT